jgi:hypothetical protein
MLENYLIVSLSDQGSFYGNEDPKYLDLDSSIDMVLGQFDKRSKEVLSNVVHEEYTLTHGDKFYFLPGVTIPRIKLKDVSNTHKIRTVREIDTADRIFVGSKTVDKITNIHWRYSCETASLLKFIEEAFLNDNMNQYYYDKIKTGLEFYTNDLVIIDYPTARLLMHSSIPYHVTAEDEWLIDGSNRFTSIVSEYETLYNQLKGKELYAEDALLEYVNGEDAVEIDDTMFDTISDMFDSSDRDNHTLAMEIMANSHYKKSLLYLILLFNKHGNVMYGAKTKNHVNFKSLTLYLNLSGNLTPSADECIDILMDKKAVNTENMNVLLEKFGNDVTIGESKYFKVKTVCFSKEVDEVLNYEMTKQLKQEFIPEVVEEEVIEEPIASTELDLIVEPETITNGTTDTNTFDFF